MNSLLFNVCCLLGILYGDPGVVKRTPENCLPLPETVAERLQRGESLEGLDNLQHAQLGSYCVRCCVWRRDPGKLQSAYLPADCDMGVCGQGDLVVSSSPKFLEGIFNVGETLGGGYPSGATGATTGAAVPPPV